MYNCNSCSQMKVTYAHSTEMSVCKVFSVILNHLFLRKKPKVLYITFYYTKGYY